MLNMKKQSGKWDVRLAVLAVILGVLPVTEIAHATTATTASAPSVNASQALPSAAPTEAPVLTQHVLQLIKEHRLVELRTIYNGPFAAAMFFNPGTLDYTVVLLKNHDFWWVGQTADGHKAEMLYTKLATQTIRLSAPDIAKIQLDARIAVARRSLLAQQKREAELTQQISAQQKIVQAGTAAQSQLLSEAQALNARRQGLERQLNQTNTAIAGLQSKAQDGPSLGSLRMLPPSSAPVPNAPSQKPDMQMRATGHP
jgi:hypothetical protein